VSSSLSAAAAAALISAMSVSAAHQ